MPYAIEFYLDKESEARIAEIWQYLKESITVGSSFIGYRPHISLAVYDFEDLDIKLMKTQIKDFTKDLEAFELSLNYIGFFPNREAIFLGPKVTKSLLKTHAKFHKKFKPHKKYLQAYYNTQNWIPHCTIAYGLSQKDFNIILLKVQNIDLPIKIKLQEIGIVYVTPEKAKEIFSIKFLM